MGCNNYPIHLYFIYQYPLAKFNYTYQLYQFAMTITFIEMKQKAVELDIHVGAKYFK